MTTEQKVYVKQLESHIAIFANFFVTKYFGPDADYRWIADEVVNGVICVNEDMFFDLGSMTEYLKYGYGFSKMVDHYYYALDCAENGAHPICIRDYRKIKK